jgi:peptidyl-prolyl cis-trans isomerase D
MFDFVKNRRLIVGAIVVLLAIPFAFFGIDSYFRGGDAVDQVASVAGTDISGREYNEALRQRQEQLRQAMRGEVDAEMLNSPEVRQAVLDQLVNERVIYASALKSGVTVTPAELHTVISEIPAFRENGGTGEFSRALYESVLRSQGMSEQAFEALLRKDLIMNRARQSVATTAFLPASVADRLYRLRAQEREVSQLVLAPQQFAARVTIEPDAVQAYYEGNPAQFEVAEKVRVEYAILSLAGVQQQVQVTPEQIREYYEERRAQFEKPEERRASHILITVPPDATPEQKTQAREKAEKVLAAAKQAPKDFAELAKENSEDPGSAMEGGDLGFFPRGRMVRSFDDAVFGMQVGEIAGPVESQFGFHIIRLESIQPAEGPKFETVQAEVGEELRKAQAGRRFAEAAETFSNLVYEQPDSLQPAVEALGLEAQTTGWITRAGGADNPLLNNEKFLKALFSDDALKHARNTEAVEIAPNMLVSARVVEHEPAKSRPFEEVRAEIVSRLTHEKAVELAKQEGEALLARLEKGEPAGGSWSAPQMVTRERRSGLHPEGAQAVFSADTSKLPAYTGLAVPDGRYVVYRISRVVNVETVDAEARKALGRQLEQAVGVESDAARLSSLKQRADVKVNPKAIETPS